MKGSELNAQNAQTSTDVESAGVDKPQQNRGLQSNYARTMPIKSRVEAGLKRLLRTGEASEYLGMSQWKLRRLVQSGEIPIIEDGFRGPWLVDCRDLDRFIDSNKLRME